MPIRSLIFLCCLLFTPLVPASNSVNDEIRRHVTQIRSGEDLTVAGETVSSLIVLPSLYERRDFAALWHKSEAIDQLLEAIDTIDADGLNSQDYHQDALLKLQQQIASSQDTPPSLSADFDLLLTDALIRLGYHLLAGKVDPEELDTNWNMNESIGDLDTILTLATAVENARVPDLLDELRPDASIYVNLKRALAHFRGIKQNGGWQNVADGATLHPGDTDPRIPAIRHRLRVTGELAEAAAADSTLFDPGLEHAVKTFQSHHGLTADGIIGPATVYAMNVSVQERADQIRVNLERARWVLHNLPDKLVLVDIAGFKVLLRENGETIWSTRAQVGKPYRRTPVFRDRIRYLEVNPTWTIPPTILRKDILPKLKKDPEYLAKKNMQVLTFSGSPVDSSSINWSLYPEKQFPYMIRQQPGPRNALGRIKFMFPNQHAVYLHDTPSRSLFERRERAFSSGCIRVQNPFEFATRLLNDPVWTEQRLKDIVASKKTTKVPLDNPITVILLYWTVNAPDPDTVIFKKDIYQRDAAVLAGLQQPFRFRKNLIIEEQTAEKSKK